MKKYIVLILSIITILVVFSSCFNSKHQFRKNYNDHKSLLYNTDNGRVKPYLKVHLKNGEVCIFEDYWKIDSVENSISGYGSLYDYNRKRVNQGQLSFNLDSIVIYETNDLTDNPVQKLYTYYGALLVGNLAVAIYCRLNPKACFGSCPTFYLDKKDNLHYADAEGFSSAVLPSLEYGDVDALEKVYMNDNKFNITLKNEALETHYIKNISLYSFQIQENQRVFHSKFENENDKFYLCENTYSLTSASDGFKNITNELKHIDKLERFSLSDSNNLLSKEEIILNFDNINNTKNLGMQIHFRQSLMTTYLFYSMLDYLGNDITDYFVKFENDKDLSKKFKSFFDELGGIDVYTWNEKRNDWIFVNSLKETGPIAINKQFLDLKLDKQLNENLKIKLVLNKGFWRIDYVSLTNIIKEVQPDIFSPSQLLNNDINQSNQLEKLINKDEYLVTMPADEYLLEFDLPKKEQYYEFFLFSKGYYLEWLRPEWTESRDLLKLNEMVNSPKKYLKNEAKAFKEYESKMEDEFWNSRIDNKTLIYNEK
jgi:hypothetical protein